MQTLNISALNLYIIQTKIGGYPVKLFIVGIKLEVANDLKFGKFLEVAAEIIKGANPNEMTLIIAHEYALSDNAVAKQIVDDFLYQAQSLIGKNENVIIAPGSISSYALVRTDSKKALKAKMLYENLSKEKFYQSDGSFQEEKNQLEFLDAPETLAVQNTAYIITHDGIHKHKKSAPINERTKLKDIRDRFNSFFHIGDGTDNKKEMVISKTCISASILICREFYNHEKNHAQFKKDPPVLELIVSDSINLKTHKDKLYGALTIHMDSKLGLTVFKNENHLCKEQFTSIHAAVYSVGKNYIDNKTISIHTYSKAMSSPVGLTKK